MDGETGKRAHTHAQQVIKTHKYFQLRERESLLLHRQRRERETRGWNYKTEKSDVNTTRGQI